MGYSKKAALLVFVFFWAVSLGGCSGMKSDLHSLIDALPGEGKENVEIATLQEESDYAGPRARIAVLRFTNATSGYWRGYNANIGDAMARQLQTALLKTNMFRVLNRKNMKDLMTEIGFGGSGAVTAGTAAQFGRMAGAKLVVTAAITEFEDSGQTSSRAKTNTRNDSFIGNLAGMIDTQQSHMAVNLEIIDVETSEIVSSETIEGSVRDVKLDLGSYGGSLGGALSSWDKTPKGKALRILINNAVAHIKTSVPRSYFTDAPKVAGARATISPQDLERNKEMQEILKELGYYDGQIDGRLGRISRQAIKDFQLDYQLEATGQLNKETREKLQEQVKKESAGLP